MATLDDSELERVTDAVRRAEAATSGEIVVLVDRAAGSYRSLSLVVAWLIALAAPWPLLWLTSLPAQALLLAQLVVALALLLALSLRGGWRLALVPRFVKRNRAHEVASREFLARGLTRTKGRTGVLIYVALAERYAEVMADIGVADKVADDVWRAIVGDLIAATAENRLADGLVAAIEAIGDILAGVAPAVDSEDELPNKVVIIG